MATQVSSHASEHTNGSSRDHSMSSSSSPSSNFTHQNKKQLTPRPKKSAVQGVIGDANLDGVVDLTDSVDTTVHTKQLAAVTHEHITPTVRTIHEEVITREIHTHEINHRVLPVIETVILPTKHYIPSADGTSLVEIQPSELQDHTLTGTTNPNWQIIATPPPASSFLSQPIQNAKYATSQNDGDGTVLGGKTLEEPVLTSKRTYMTEHGYPRTEYVWHHPPVWETSDGRTQYIFRGVELSINGEQRRQKGYARNSGSAGETSILRSVAGGDTRNSVDEHRSNLDGESHHRRKGSVAHARASIDTRRSSTSRKPIGFEHTRYDDDSTPRTIHGIEQLDSQRYHSRGPSLDNGSRAGRNGVHSRGPSGDYGYSSAGGEATRSLKRMKNRDSLQAVAKFQERPAGGDDGQGGFAAEVERGLRGVKN